jgi:hypothetical protein
MTHRLRCQTSAKYGSKLACTTMGERGALAWDGQHLRAGVQRSGGGYHGAGDLFHADLLMVFMRRSTQRLLELVRAAAGLSCTAHGEGRHRHTRSVERLQSTRSAIPSNTLRLRLPKQRSTFLAAPSRCERLSASCFFLYATKIRPASLPTSTSPCCGKRRRVSYQLSLEATAGPRLSKTFELANAMVPARVSGFFAGRSSKPLSFPAHQYVPARWVCTYPAICCSSGFATMWRRNSAT